MNRLLRGVAAGVAMLTFGMGTASAQIKWDLPNEYAATSIFGEGDIFFANLLKEKTKGQIQITNHFGGSLGYKSKDHFDAVTDGAVPLADSYTGVFGGIDPVFLLSSLPFLAASTAQAKALFTTARPYYERAYGKHNQMLLIATPWPPSGIWAKKPVTNLGELKNLKIRSFDANGTKTLSAAGAAPIQLSWADVIPQLSTGGIEAVLTSAEGGVNSKFWEHLSHFTEINYAMPLSMTHMNKGVFAKLSAEHQKAVREAAEATSERNWGVLDGRVAQNYKDMTANRMTVITKVAPEYLRQLSDAGKAALQDWTQKMGADGDKIMAEYRKMVGSGS